MPKAVAYTCQDWIWPVTISRANAANINPSITWATNICVLRE